MSFVIRSPPHFVLLQHKYTRLSFSSSCLCVESQRRIASSKSLSSFPLAPHSLPRVNMYLRLYHIKQMMGAIQRALAARRTKIEDGAVEGESSESEWEDEDGDEAENYTASMYDTQL
eukprot:m.336954 g.336954  ORF g.336954 m.336954 type:complete len:117 (+) comp16078_c2_seq63:81-431(+)